MHCPYWLETQFGFKYPNGFQVLEADALVVLGAAGEDFSVGGGVVGGEGRVGPLGGFGGDGVEVGVEEDGREGGVGAWPGEEEEGFGFGRGEVEDLGSEV